jgi:hypothetical protein
MGKNVYEIIKSGNQTEFYELLYHALKTSQYFSELEKEDLNEVKFEDPNSASLEVIDRIQDMDILKYDFRILDGIDFARRILN